MVRMENIHTAAYLLMKELVKDFEGDADGRFCGEYHCPEIYKDKVRIVEEFLLKYVWGSHPNAEK